MAKVMRQHFLPPLSIYWRRVVLTVAEPSNNQTSPMLYALLLQECEPNSGPCCDSNGKLRSSTTECR